MKLAKKALSVFLSLLMIFGTCSVCLAGFSFTAAAATGTATSVKATLPSVAAKINSVTASGNSYTYSGDDGSVIAAAEEVFAYTVSLRGGTGSTSSNNATDTLLADVAAGTGYTSGANYNALVRLINPAGNTVYGYENRRTRSDRHWAGQDHKYPSLDANSITKTSRVNATLDNVLLTYDSVEDIPATILLSVTYQYVHTYGQTASDGSYNWRKGYKCNAARWNYLSSVTRTVNSQNTTAASELQGYDAYFSDSRLAGTAEDMLSMSATELEALYNEASGKYESLTASYSDAVVNHFFDTAAIESYLNEVLFALQVVLAQPAMRILMDCINNGYDAENLDEMLSVYATATDAYDIVDDYSETIIDFVIANYEGYDNFSLTASKEFIDKLYFDIELYQLRELKKSIDADIAAYETLVADPENKEDITDIELAAIRDKFIGYAASWVQYSDEANAAVFTDGKGYIDDFRAAVALKIETRAVQVEYTAYYEYFLPYIFANIADWSKEEIVVRYNEDTAKQSELIADYEAAVGVIGTELTESVYTMTYNDGQTLLTQAVADYIARLLVVVEEKNNAQLDAVAEYVGTDTTVDFDNFLGLKTAIEKVNHELYDIALDNGLVDAERKAIYDALSQLLVNYNAFVESGGLNKFVQKHYHDENGVYVVRYAGDQTDADGNQIGYVNDEARDGEEDNYIVDEAKVNETIVKLDNFILSEDFCSIVGFEDEEGNPFNSLSDYIDDLIQTNLFTDELVNNLIASLFPMLCTTVADLLGDLSGLGIDGINKSPDGNAAARLDLSTLSGGDFKGSLDLYIDGKYNSIPLVTVFESLKLYLYPQSLAKVIPSEYPEIKSALAAAGTDWSKFEDENGDMVLDFEWGVNNYDTFVDAMGVMFSAILPLLQTALCGNNYSQKVSRLAFIKGYDMKIKVSGITLDITYAEAYANATINIPGLTLFKDLWIPLMEKLGVTESGYDLTALGYKGAYTFKTLSKTASAAQIADAMFEPVLVLIEQLKQMPLQKLLDILPQLVYTLSFDEIQAMIDKVEIPLAVELEIDEFTDVDFELFWGIEIGLTSVANALKSTINGFLPSFDVDLKLADMVNLKDMLGFDYTNINSLLAFVLESMGMDVEFPIINAGEIICCSSVNKNAPSASNAGTRVKFTADRADVFYFLLEYIIDAIGDRDFVEALIEFITAPELTVDTDGDGIADAPEEPAEEVVLPDLVYQIIDNVHAHPENALAALVELFCPQAYSKQTMDWYASDYTYGGIEGMNDASIVYLTYGNDWTKESADYVIDNIDAILESVLEMTGSQETQINVLIQDAINGLFVSDSLTAVIQGLAGLDELDDVIYSILESDGLDINLRAMGDAFSYLFVTEEEAAAEGFVAPPAPGDADYVNTTKLTAQKDAEGVITWYYDGVAFDGSREMFVDIFCEAIAEFAPIVATFFSGNDLSVFGGAINVLGYENYADSIGIFFEMLGIEDVLTQSEYKAMCDEDPVAAMKYLINQLFGWLDEMLVGNTVEKLLEIVPEFMYFIESNGLSTVLHNLLMPVLVILDDVRPIIDINLNSLLSYILSEYVNYGEINTDALLQFIGGIWVNDDADYKYLTIDLDNLRISDILDIVDAFFGTALAESQLANPGIAALCSGAVEYSSVMTGGKAYKSTMDASDALTIVLSALIECLEYEASEGVTNADIIFTYVEEQTGEEDITQIVNAVLDIIKGYDVEYTVPDWDYMFSAEITLGEKVTLPERSIVYLGYSTDWTRETADSVYETLDEVLELVLAETVGEGTTVATLINGLLEDNVYSDEILNELVELIVNAIAGLDENLRDLVDVVITTDIGAWFDMCTQTTDEEGNTVYVCTADWGVDAAAEADKKDVFVQSIKTVLEPANSLLSWLFFGTDYEFFTGTQQNADGTYKYNDIININGGEGYAYGLVPVLEALGCELRSADSYYIDENTYDVPQAVEDIFNSLLTVVDEISAQPIEEVFALLPNIIYFINADGLKSSVNNLLAPVDAIVEALSPIISEDGSTGNLGGLLAEEIGFDIQDLTTDTLLGIAAENGFVMNDEMYQLLTTFYVGELSQFTSANGNYAYSMTYTDEESAYDMLTIVLCFALDAFNVNEELFSDLLGADTYKAIKNLIAGAVSEFSYLQPDWAYMYEGEDALDKLIADNLPERTQENSIVYTQYTNNWNKATSDYLDSILTELIFGITQDARDDGKTVGILLDEAVAKGLYKDSILDSLVEALVELMLDYEDIIKGAGILLGAEGISVWFDDYCEITYDENGEPVVTCVKDWGIDAEATTQGKRDAFVDAFVEVLEPAYDLLAWLFFAQDYTFFDGTTNEVLVTVKGGYGYAYGLIPLLEALGCTMQSPDAFLNADGTYDMEKAVRHVFETLTDWLYMICGDMEADEETRKQGAVEQMLELLPNVVYFLNADGAKAVAHNLLAPVNFILETLAPVTGSDSLDEMTGFPISSLDFYTIFDIVEQEVGLYFPDDVQKFVDELYMGEVVEYTSANGLQAFRMQYTAQEPRGDMTTILISLVLESAQDERNADKLSDWLGTDIYDAIMKVLRLEACKPMEEYEWILTQYANTGEQFSAIETSERYAVYNEYWTKDQAQYIADNFNYLVGNLLCLLGIEINGVVTHDIYDLLNTVVGQNIYTQETADTILEGIKDLLAKLEELEPYGEYITQVLDTAFGIDITVYDDMVVTVEEGSREDFENALSQMLVPIVPLLNVILCGEDISLFLELDGEDTITIYGSEGYAYGIIPIFEALGCEMMTPEQYKSAVENDPAAAISHLTTPLLDMVDKLMQEPLGGIIELLPAVMYFVNSNGVETGFTNLVAAVDTVLGCLDSVIDETSVEELIGIELEDFNAQYIVDLLVDMLNESTGMDFSSLALSLVSELTFGEVVDYKSANGETYYTMVADERDTADMTTAILRIAIDFITTQDNLEYFKALLAENITDEDSLNSIYSILDSLAQYVAEDPGMSQALSFVYYIFYGASEAAENVDDAYHDINNSWMLILKMFETSDDPLIKSFGKTLSNTLDTYFDGIFDSEGLASDGAVTFWEKIKAFFERIAEFFRKLFGMN